MIKVEDIKFAEEYAARYLRHLPVIGIFREALIASRENDAHIWQVDELESHGEEFSVKHGRLKIHFSLGFRTQPGDFGAVLRISFDDGSCDDGWKALAPVTVNSKAKTQLRDTGENELFLSNPSGAREFFQSVVASALAAE
ncbi:MAG: hypothetical protein EOO27_07065 [Comamonadaceae bacterium]|nr:MAG: hypothetical protein EOO27_07065 [Comamonadaceae bacterium]